MARDDRPPSFQMYPADWLSSTAVSLMTPEEEGAYFRLLCHSWLQDEQGTLPDDDESLARLSRLGERWGICRTSIRRAFVVRSDGRLYNSRMVDERKKQLERYIQARNGALITNDIRWGKVARRPDSESQSGRPSVTPSSSSSSSSSLESKKTHRSRPLAGYSDTFEEWFRNYPRRAAKANAFRAYLKALARTDEKSLTEGVNRYKASLNGTPPDKIKHPATWLNGDCWLDELATGEPVEESMVARIRRQLEAE